MEMLLSLILLVLVIAFWRPISTVLAALLVLAVPVALLGSLAVAAILIL